jgi:hypothetical protein
VVGRCNARPSTQDHLAAEKLAGLFTQWAGERLVSRIHDVGTGGDGATARHFLRCRRKCRDGKEANSLPNRRIIEKETRVS